MTCFKKKSKRWLKSSNVYIPFVSKGGGKKPASVWKATKGRGKSGKSRKRLLKPPFYGIKGSAILSEKRVKHLFDRKKARRIQEWLTNEDACIIHKFSTFIPFTSFQDMSAHGFPERKYNLEVIRTLKTWNQGTLESWNHGTMERLNVRSWNHGTMEP